jgi:hypothetical protein
MREWAVGGDRYILGMHPHGVVPLQAFVWCAYCDQYLRDEALGGTLYGFGGMATVVTHLPVLRTLLGWLSGTAARYETLKRGLQAGKNLYMLPGGLAEIFCAAPGTHAAVWRKRRGLVKLALETGCRLTPLYIFGGNETFHQMITSDSWVAQQSRALGASVTFFWGGSLRVHSGRAKRHSRSQRPSDTCRYYSTILLLCYTILYYYCATLHYITIILYSQAAGGGCPSCRAGHPTA